MKKIFMTFSTAATFSAAILLTSCNNAEQVKKQVDEQNSKIQTAVDEKLGGLNEEVSKACAATVDSLAGVAFTAWQEEQAKATKGKKPVAKAKPAPKPKKEEPKVDPQKARAGGSGTPAEVQKQRNGDPQKTDAQNQKKRN